MSQIAGDRRDSVRYALQLRMRYRVMDGDKVLWSGNSMTEDLSRTGVRFQACHEIPADSRLEIAVEWPVPFGGIYPMELDLTGSIVRRNDGEWVARVAHWRFRVRDGEPEGAEQPGRAYGWGLRQGRGEERLARAIMM
jgi:hypothetical protein